MDGGIIINEIQRLTGVTVKVTFTPSADVAGGTVILCKWIHPTYGGEHGAVALARTTADLPTR
jgi:hypothetical protein